MSGYNSNADLEDVFRALRAEISAIQNQPKNPVQQYTTATLPDPTTCKGLIVLDTTAAVFKGSNGTAWLTF